MDPNSGIDKPWRRNAAIIWLDFASSSARQLTDIDVVECDGQDPSSNLGHLASRTTIIVEYLQKYGDTSVAYEDVRPHVESLEAQERSGILEVLLRNTFNRTDDTEDGASESMESSLSPENQKV